MRHTLLLTRASGTPAMHVSALRRSQPTLLACSCLLCCDHCRVGIEMTRVEVKFQDLTIDTKVAPACVMQSACKGQLSNRAATQNVRSATKCYREPCRPSQSSFHPGVCWQPRAAICHQRIPQCPGGERTVLCLSGPDGPARGVIAHLQSRMMLKVTSPTTWSIRPACCTPLQAAISLVGIKLAQKRQFQILRGVSGIIKPVCC